MKTLFLPLSRYQFWLKFPGKTLLPTALLLGIVASAEAQTSNSFPRNVTFKGATESNFTISGSARLTGTGATGDDAVGQGYLRLTGAEGNKAGSIIDNVGFDAPEGFTISFEFFAYGGNGADGFSVFLVDEAGQPATGFRVGASGGSLGYAQKTDVPTADGVSRGYIGIGIDEFGNFANPTEGRVGGIGFIPDAVSIRGAGDGRTTADYPYLAGTGLGELGFSLDVPTARAQPGSADYRRAFIDVIPTGTGTSRTYDITVRIQHGTAVTTAVRQFRVATPPSRLRLGFSGSTGGSTNVHEIRNLNIVQAPFAVDDVASTIFNDPISLNVTSNDVAPGASIDRATVDLDIDAPGIQDTRTIANKGTFTVTNTGAVTFTPVSTFAGIVTLPYNVQDILSQLSSPANITIIVEGADVATSASGPSYATASSNVTYTMTTTNLGTQPATDVVPKLRLSPSVSSAGMTLPAGANYNAATGEVTFATIADLAVGAPAVINTVSFTVPANGTLTGTASSISNIPDPVADNNTATITTTIGGSVNVITACATPGKDGPATLTSNSPVPNTYFPGTGATTTNGVSYITVGAAQAGAKAIEAGDLVLVMQMQGLDVNTSNTSAYGTPNSNGTAGQYEYAVAANSVGLLGGILTLASPLTNTYNNYNNQDTPNATSGIRRFQVIRVPQYSALTINGTVTGTAWNGQTGGVLVLDVAGRTTMSGTGSGLDMTAKGFRGGGGAQYTSSTYSNTDYRNSAGLLTTGAHGSKGEGTAGTPRFVYTGGNSVTNTNLLAEGYYANGSVGRGAPGNAGGGATDFAPASNSGNAGGAGGGNGGVGGTGGFGYGSGPDGNGINAIGGAAKLGDISKLVLGGGGGAGSTNRNNAHLSSGGIGGGVVILRTGSVSGTGIIQANGAAAPDARGNEGGGGGGAGGSVLLLASPPTGIAGGTGLNNLTVSANGGNGSRGDNDNGGLYGPGGGGGGGILYANGVLAGSSVRGGTAGLAVSTNPTSTYGAAGGSNGTATTNADATTNDGAISGAGACLPVLTASLEALTPQVRRTGDPGQPVQPASYRLTIVNTGGIAKDVRAIVALATNGVANNEGPFRYQSSGTTVLQRLANGVLSTLAAATNYVAPTNNSINPTFSGLTIPAGATMVINFVSNVAGTALDNVAYQTTASITYSDPTRSSASRTVGPAGFYEAGGEVPGSNYSGASSTAEDVTVLRPLPVELKRFEAAAAGLNTDLAWATATELQNDHFDIERSLDGHNFDQIGVVKGQGTSSKETAYRHTDVGAGRLSLKPIYYRLRQVDRDGSSSYSPIRVVRFERGAKVAIALYPNPHQGTATLDLSALPSTASRIEVLDLSGRVVRQVELLGGLKHSLDLNALPLGSYLVRVRNSEAILTLPMIRN